MPKNGRTWPSARAPWGLVGLVVLVGLIEWLIEARCFDFLDRTTMTWRTSGRSARVEATTSEILCFGDSLLKFGLLPEVLERRTGKRAYNLAVNAGRAPASYFLLRRALETGARPSAVLIDFEPNILSQSPLLSPESWAELLSARECVELAWSARDGAFVGRTLLLRLFASARYRYAVRAIIVERLGGRPSAPADHVVSLCRNIGRNRGALVMPHHPRAPTDVAPPNPVFFPADWRCDRMNGHFLRQFFALASARGIPVFLVITPYSPTIQAWREAIGPDAAFSRFAQGVQARFPNVTVLDARRADYDPGVFWDGTVHLDVRGALALSHDVATVLSRAFSRESLSRWIRLPPYRPRPVEAFVEDIDQSTVVLRAERDRIAR